MYTHLEPKRGFSNRKKLLTAVIGLGITLILVAGLSGGIVSPTQASISASQQTDRVEPDAGQWRTWLLESGSQLRPPAPPDKQASQAEIQELQELVEQRDPDTLDQISFWNTGAPVYRWNEIAVYEALQHGMSVITAGRALALLHAALYDATIAAWDAKYTYDRPRPSDAFTPFAPAIENPRSPSYPSEHAVVAGAASEVLAYLFPDRADVFREKAAQVGELVLIAGIQYPSDVEAGQELGRQVAALAIERAMNDGSDAQWDGILPDEPGIWNGQNPIAPMAGTWQTWALDSGSEFRPGPPYAYDSPEKAAELEELRNFERTPKSNAVALYWEWGSGGTRNYVNWNEQLSRKLLEYQLGDNPPLSARAYALESIAFYDAMVACFDAKYTYWAIRPFQLDSTFQTVFPTPNHPSYPAAHSCLSTAAAEMMAYLFPREGSTFLELAEQAGESRIWAGIHYRSDIVSGTQLGRDVANKVIGIAENDGSQ